MEDTTPHPSQTQPDQTATPTAPAQVPAAATGRTRAANAQSPSADQLTLQRAKHWHQDGNALLSIETVRAWIQQSGLVLFSPKPQLGAPTPSLVEATLGKPSAAPELADFEVARSLMARLIAEGSAVPLNLLGVTGGMGTDVPDFVVSAAVFSYIFTLRGNKAWKQSPVTSGPVKVSPLALATYELLSAKVTLSAYDLTTQLGKEVTETAVLRALTELWSQLRVLPVPQQDGSATLWELASGRFTKQIKAGANAGQPSALSALISLYLGQAVIATEDEIESFLSPLAPRSRVRDVVHALMAARQLETLVIDGKTLLHVGGELPAFAAVKADETETAETGEAAEDGSGSRISKFAAKPGSKIGTGLRAKPSFGKKPAFGEKRGFGAKPAFGRSAPAGDRERRPFQKREDRGGSSRPARPAFDKPWDENRPSRPANAEGGARPPRREFTPRTEGEGERPKRTFSKPGTFGRKREGFSGGPGADRGSSEGRPPRRDFADRGERPAGGGFKRPGSYTPRPSGGGGFGGERLGGAGRPSYGAKPGFQRDRGERPAGAEGGAEAPRKVFRKFDAPRSPKPFGDRAGSGPKPAFGSKPAFGGKPSFGSRPSSGPGPFDGERPKRSFDGTRPGGFAGRSDRPDRSERAGRSDFAGRSERPRTEGRPPFGSKPGGFGAKKPFSKPGGAFAGKGGPFAKFADGNKPFRKPGAPKKGGGGFSPTRRRDEGGK